MLPSFMYLSRSWPICEMLFLAMLFICNISGGNYFGTEKSNGRELLHTMLSED